MAEVQRTLAIIKPDAVERQLVGAIIQRIEEEDLRIRGPGDYLGTRQSGLPDLKMAKITDYDILSLAREEAARILESDPELVGPENALLAEHLRLAPRPQSAETAECRIPGTTVVECRQRRKPMPLYEYNCRLCDEGFEKLLV